MFGEESEEKMTRSRITYFYYYIDVCLKEGIDVFFVLLKTRKDASSINHNILISQPLIHSEFILSRPTSSFP